MRAPKGESFHKLNSSMDLCIALLKYWHVNATKAGVPDKIKVWMLRRSDRTQLWPDLGTLRASLN